MRRALAIDPKNDDAYFNLAEYYFDRGEAEEAVELLKRALAINRKIGRPIRGWSDIIATRGSMTKKRNF